MTKSNKALILLGFILVLVSGCGGSEGGGAGGEGSVSGPSDPVGVVLDDGSVVRGRAVYETSTSNTVSLLRYLDLIPRAYAATGTTTVTYTNAAAVSFTINVASFGAQGFSGTTLNLGNVVLSGLDDNHLKVCGVGGNQKCNNSAIRVYTTGTVAGFVNTVDGYGAPLYAGTLNPSTAVGLNTAGSVQVQTVAIPANKNRLRLVDFTSPTYAVTSDFSNAGSGDYSMTFVVEYVLLP